jgi:hypothetical protein
MPSMTSWYLGNELYVMVTGQFKEPMLSYILALLGSLRAKVTTLQRGEVHALPDTVARPLRRPESLRPA